MNQYVSNEIVLQWKNFDQHIDGASFPVMSMYLLGNGNLGKEQTDWRDTFFFFLSSLLQNRRVVPCVLSLKPLFGLLGTQKV